MRLRELGEEGVSLAAGPEAARAVVAGADVELRLALSSDDELALPARVREARLEDPRNPEGLAVELELSSLPVAVERRLADLRAGFRPRVLLVGLAPARRTALGARLRFGIDVLTADDVDEALALLSSPSGDALAALITGENLRGEPARRLVAEARIGRREEGILYLVLAGGADLSIFQDLIDQDRLFFLSQEPPSDDDLAAIAGSAVRRWWSSRSRRGPEEAGEPADAADERAARAQVVVEIARRVGLQTDAATAGDLVAEGLRELVDADRAHYLLYDDVEEVLWAGQRDAPGERRESAAVGLVSFAVRTARAVRVSPAGADARWDRDADDPEGDGGEALLVVPVRNAGRRVLGVLVAVRREGRRPFGDEETGLLALLAEHVASTFARFALERRLELLDRDDGDETGVRAESIYRRRALEEHAAGAGERGDVLRISPSWTRWTYRLLLAVIAAALFAGTFVRVPEYASGPAVVNVGGIRTVSAVAAGTVSHVEVAPGERVEVGDHLVRFYGARELAELERIDHELELQLLDRLRDPGDPASGRALVSLRAQRELAEARLEERRLTAPVSGTVADLRVREGQPVTPGDAVVSLAVGRSETSVVCLLPGSYRPLLEPGMPLRLELAGFPGVYQELTIGTVGQEVLGPAEARRYLGPGRADTVALSGPVVVVEARLPGGTFTIGDRSYAFHDGMLATAEVPVRSEPIFVTLVPDLRVLFADG